MAETPRVGDLEIFQDLAHQRREWTFQRGAWIVMAAVLLLALAGLFGRGPLSATRAAAVDDSLVAHYDRFLNRHDPTEITLLAPRVERTGEEVRIRIQRDYIASFEIACITPEPERVEVEQDVLAYVFRLGDPGAALEITFLLEPQELGSLAGEARIDEGQPVALRQFVYP